MAMSSIRGRIALVADPRWMGDAIKVAWSSTRGDAILPVVQHKPYGTLHALHLAMRSLVSSTLENGYGPIAFLLGDNIPPRGCLQQAIQHLEVDRTIFFIKAIRRI